MTVSYQAEREQVAIACRILAAEGLAAAMLHAIDVHVMAGLTVTCAQTQRSLTEIAADDYRNLPVFGQEYYDQLWRCYVAKAGRMGNQHA